jgi:hypothetical protein
MPSPAHAGMFAAGMVYTMIFYYAVILPGFTTFDVFTGSQIVLVSSVHLKLFHFHNKSWLFLVKILTLLV